MTYRKPQATVLAVQTGGGLCRIAVELECEPWRPLAPASLCRDDDPSVTLVELHRLVELTGHRASFESLASGAPVLEDGDVVVLRSWWRSDQLEVARNSPPRAWRRAPFAPHDSVMYHPDGRIEHVPDGWDHEHCVLCWETFDENAPYGYVSGDDWLCGKCYDDYIVSGFGARLGDEV